MANECENRENESDNVERQQNGQVKGYRKRGLVCEKVLHDRLSDGSLEEAAPVITLSSFETGGPGQDGRDETRAKGSLKPSLSLDVPSMKLAEEAKRPPL